MRANCLAFRRAQRRKSSGTIPRPLCAWCHPRGVRRFSRRLRRSATEIASPRSLTINSGENRWRSWRDAPVVCVSPYVASPTTCQLSRLRSFLDETRAASRTVLSRRVECSGSVRSAPLRPPSGATCSNDGLLLLQGASSRGPLTEDISITLGDKSRKRGSQT